MSNATIGSQAWQERVENAPLQLFEAVKTIVEMSGGDGWGIIISPEYERLADLFEESQGRFTRRKDWEDEIVFAAYPEESVTFTRHKPEHNKYYEIVVEYRWPMLEELT